MAFPDGTDHTRSPQKLIITTSPRCSLRRRFSPVELLRTKSGAFPPVRPEDAMLVSANKANSAPSAILLSPFIVQFPSRSKFVSQRNAKKTKTKSRSHDLNHRFQRSRDRNEVPPSSTRQGLTNSRQDRWHLDFRRATGHSG